MVSFSEVRSSLLTSSPSKFFSNMLRLKLRSLEGEFPSGNITFTLPNHFEQIFGTLVEGDTFNTTCEEGVIRSAESHSCEMGAGSDLTEVLLIHECVGVSELLSTRCPVVSKTPVCVLSDPSSDVSCSVLSYTKSETVCTCFFVSSRTAENDIRRLAF